MTATAPLDSSTCPLTPGAILKQAYLRSLAAADKQHAGANPEATNATSQPLNQDNQSAPPPPLRREPQSKSILEVIQKALEGDVNPDAQVSEDATAESHSQPPGCSENPATNPSAPSEETAEERAMKRKRKANTIMYTFVDRQMQAMLQKELGSYASDEVFAEVHDQYAATAGYPKHPSAVILIQEIVLLHLLKVVLYRRGLETTSLEATKLYLHEASRMSEMLRKAIAQLHELCGSLQKRSGKQQCDHAVVSDIDNSRQANKPPGEAPRQSA